MQNSRKLVIFPKQVKLWIFVIIIINIYFFKIGKVGFVIKHAWKKNDTIFGSFDYCKKRLILTLVRVNRLNVNVISSQRHFSLCARMQAKFVHKKGRFARFSNFAPKKRARHNSAARTRKRLLMPPIGGFHAPRAGFSEIPPTRFNLPRNLKNRAVKKNARVSSLKIKLTVR